MQSGEKEKEGERETERSEKFRVGSARGIVMRIHTCPTDFRVELTAVFRRCIYDTQNIQKRTPHVVYDAAILSYLIYSSHDISTIMGSDKCDKPQRDVAVSIVYDKSTSRILMVTRRKHPKIWICEFWDLSGLLDPGLIAYKRIVPQGGVEAGETSGQAAIRESWEEGKSYFFVMNLAKY